jgi:hypothetical protein
METVWKLDEQVRHKASEAAKYLSDRGYDKGTNPKFKVGDVIQFMTGYNDDILAEASIKGIDGNDLYVYDDCYWFPIQDDTKRKIRIV